MRLCDEERQAQIRFEADTFRLVQVGWFTALALTLHNIPEGTPEPLISAGFRHQLGRLLLIMGSEIDMLFEGFSTVDSENDINFSV